MAEEKHTVAIITARGGSKRIPRKNIKNFCGQPIMKYSIDAAVESGIFSEVMVSTDDDEIAQAAREFGAKVPFMRSAENSNDFAATADVISEVLLNYEERDKHFDYFCCIYPTAPFLTAERLRAAMNVLTNSEADTLLPIVKFSFPPQRSVIVDQGLVRPVYEKNMSARSQDLEPMYHDCGQFYCGNCATFLDKKKLITDNTIPYLLSETEAQDIDNLEDWLIAEVKYRMLHQMEK